MQFNEGDLVVVLGKLTNKGEYENNGLIIGTFIGYLSDKKVQVLLPDGRIFVGNLYEISTLENQS